MRLIFSLFIAVLILNTGSAQGLKKLIQKATGSETKQGNLSSDEVAGGLKEALNQGVQKGTAKLSAVDGFFKDAAIKILMPQEAQNVIEAVRKVPGGDKMVDDAILSMNRAAEDAAKGAAPIFVNAIKGMSISDAFGILRGGDTAATAYLRKQTTNQLTEAFRPVIEQSLAKVNATQHWNTVFSTYNRFALKKVNPDLAGYVTDKALYGIFYQVAEEERKIRKDPLAQTTNLLKKVFGSN